MRFVVLEGADASGKTTLARAIAGDGSYLHGSPFVGFNLEAHREMLRYASFMTERGEPVVLDRTWVSEFVYGPIFRGGPAPEWTDEEAERFDKELRARAVTVLCAPQDLERQERRWLDGRAAGKREHFNSAREAIAFYADLARGNVAHPGPTYLDRYVRHGDFVPRGSCLLYDVDVDGKDLEGFARKVRRAAGW